MKKLRVIALASQREELFQGLLHLGCVEISEPDAKLSDPEWTALLQRNTVDRSATRAQIASVRTALEAVKQYGKAKDGLFIQRRTVSEADFLSPETVEQARNVSEKTGSLLQNLSRLRTEAARLEARRAGLTPWEELDLPLEQSGTAHTVFHMEVCPASVELDDVRDALNRYAADIQEISSDRQQHYTLLTVHRDDAGAVQDVLRPFSFSVTGFPGVTGTAAANIAELNRQLDENAREQERMVSELEQCAENRDILRLYADRLEAEASKESGAANLLTDGTIVFFEGWVPDDKMYLVRNFLDENRCAWDESDPEPEDKPPVQLRSNILTRPLNMVTEMYSLPDYHNVDPNPFMAPFFILFYGIMMADMGYGLLMILAGVLVTRKYRPKGTAGHLFGLLTLCGISTFVMGMLTGGFFGDFLTQFVKLVSGADFTLPALFTPLDDTLMILVGSMCLGFVQIVTGMAISFGLKMRRKQYLDALFEEVTWWIVFAGIALMVLNVTDLLLYIGIVLVIAGPVVTGEGIGKISGIFGSLYSHVTGYFGDILSYSRLMALMLAGSVIAQVFNTLGAIPGNVIVFLVISLAGNTLNFALNLLGCYVHDLRLQCLEYFGKFYEDGGRPFRPVAINTKFVDVQPS